VVKRSPAKPKRSPPAEPDAVIEYGPLANWVGFNLRIAQIAAFQAFAREARAIGVSTGRFAVLMLIEQNPGIRQTELSRANARDKSSLTPVLEDLVRSGLVLRERVVHDRRAYRLTLTAPGRAMLAKLLVCAKRHEANIEGILGARDSANLVRILKKLSDGLTES
jgi:DNA-binding MarR family transcriptional regulator